MENIELRSQWEDIVRRLQQSTRQSPGVVMVEMKLFAKDGRPLFWLPPEVIPVEPRLRITPDVLFHELTAEQMQGILERIFT